MQHNIPQESSRHAAPRQHHSQPVPRARYPVCVISNDCAASVQCVNMPCNPQRLHYNTVISNHCAASVLCVNTPCNPQRHHYDTVEGKGSDCSSTSKKSQAPMVRHMPHCVSLEVKIFSCKDCGLCMCMLCRAAALALPQSGGTIHASDA